MPQAGAGINSGSEHQMRQVAAGTELGCESSAVVFAEHVGEAMLDSASKRRRLIRKQMGPKSDLAIVNLLSDDDDEIEIALCHSHGGNACCPGVCVSSGDGLFQCRIVFLQQVAQFYLLIKFALWHPMLVCNLLWCKQWSMLGCVVGLN